MKQLIGKKRNIVTGFTLIELLVVIGIIAVLAAILFPVFAQVKEKARQTVCLSNMKQISLGMIQYTQDNDDVYPAADMGPGGLYGPNTDTYSWAQAIYPYIKSATVYQCPSDKITPSRWHNTDADGRDIARSYLPIIQWNGNSNPAQQGLMEDGGGTESVSSNAVTQPSSTVWLTEAGQNLNESNGTCWDSPCRSMVFAGTAPGLYIGQRANFLPNGTNPHTVGANHKGGSTWCFADGHAKWLRVEQTINMTDPSKDLWLRSKGDE